MESPAGKSSSNNDFLNMPKDTQNSKMTNKEIREEYFNQLRSWLTTVNSYQCYYNKIQQESLQNNYQKVFKNPTEIPRDVPNVSETPTVGPSQFVGMS